MKQIHSGVGGSPVVAIILLCLLLFGLPSSHCFCPYRCDCNEVTLTVYCDGASLDYVPITLNPVLQELHLSGNKIKSITSSFTVYQNLRFLDISQNFLSSLEGDNFLEQRNLRVLQVNNNKIASLKTKAFVGLTALKILRLENNGILNIDDKAFQPLVSLEVLDLSMNSISSLSPSSLFGLTNLKELFLKGNKLVRIPTESFQSVKTLHSLDLGMNSFYVIPNSSFHFLHNLKVLSLDSCNIHIIEIGAFHGATNLLSLFLQDNEIQRVPTDVLLEIDFIQEVHLGKNNLQKLGPEDFRGLNSLKTISISGEDQLEFIENGTFIDNYRLERLIISHNPHLRRIEEGTFRGLSNLRFLSLQGNQFTTFHEDMLSWDKLEVLDVRENPLICNCSLLWLWNILKRQNTSAYGEDVTRVRCRYPPDLEDQLLVDIGPVDMDCGNQSLKQILTVVIPGACLVLAVVAMLVFWHRYKYAVRQKRKLGQSKRTLYQYGQGSDNFSPILSQIIQQPFKSPAIAEL